MSFAINVSDIQNIKTYLNRMPTEARSALSQSINAALRYAYAESSRQIRAQVNFPQDYIGSAQSGNRLTITQYSNPDSLVGVISARQRPVSLARFVKNRAITPGKVGVDVEVKPGHVVHMENAFLLRLRSGQMLSQDQFNLGLAIRLKDGESVKGRTKATRLDNGRNKNVYLLYGPSVDQVFNSVRDDVAPAVFDFLQSEFYRQINRKLSA